MVLLECLSFQMNLSGSMPYGKSLDLHINVFAWAVRKLGTFLFFPFLSNGLESRCTEPESLISLILLQLHDCCQLSGQDNLNPCMSWSLNHIHPELVWRQCNQYFLHASFSAECSSKDKGKTFIIISHIFILGKAIAGKRAHSRSEMGYSWWFNRYSWNKSIMG